MSDHYCCRKCNQHFDFCQCSKDLPTRPAYVTVLLQRSKPGRVVEIEVEHAKVHGSNIIVHEGRYYVYGGMDSHLRMRFNETNHPVTLP